MISRRIILAGMGGAAIFASTGALGQQEPVRTIGFLGANTPEAAGHLTAVFIARLQDLGWVEGKNLRISYRWAAGQTSRFRALAEELVAEDVQVIITSGDVAGRAARAATKMVPISSRRKRRRIWKLAGLLHRIYEHLHASGRRAKHDRRRCDCRQPR